MKGGRLFCFMVALQIMSCCVSVTSRPFSPTDDLSHPAGPKQVPAPESSPPYTIESEKGLMVREKMTERMKEEAYYDRRIGSSPPSCEHKCYGCTPCEAIQVPSTSRSSSRRRHSHLGIQYANYEPESWKCKCGPSFYSP
ncbi:EPIDERMAL PATTERNING FACTOR-like protein 6 [Lotus japonicus]|uniref:EPIDERMAL PATTERNING FACTOR-like protein 6 n=1 Tax=Lotus japonicus TaxID=34305 RepID=UPI00258366F5|nr:EPIDERMAL PATTERNING FACTOR-like protein 6 [Lotus japonicus]